MNSASIQINNLSKTFVLHNQGGAELPVLDGASLTVMPGECVVLDGPSGAGKSTLLKCVYGTYRASAGEILVTTRQATVDITTARDQEVLRLRRDTIAYVSQFLRVIPRVPAIDVVAESVLGDIPHDEDSLKRARFEAQHLLLRLRIPQRLWHVPPATFSGGEQQRVNIARSFVRPLPVMLLDEPTASLDAENRTTVIAMIREARDQGAAILGIFHDEATRNAVASRVINMAEFQ
ncbi:MAG: phosphonate C-P lyase system protein PhnL [Betaproteobacteria bacterium]|nr:MAG: phosphonate C-P lyase system protein PhnL [Betaproteobacteria bacterium]